MSPSRTTTAGGIGSGAGAGYSKGGGSTLDQIEETPDFDQRQNTDDYTRQTSATPSSSSTTKARVLMQPNYKLN
jgi:hypothetical protein